LKSVTQKVLIILVIGIVFIMVSAGGTYFTSERQKALRHIQEMADKTADRISNSLIYPLWNISKEEIEKTISLEMAEENIIAITLKDEDNQFLTGKIKDFQGRILNYEPDGNHDILIKNSLVTVKRKISKGSEYLGEVTLYFTDRYLLQYLNELIIKIILLTALLSVFTVVIIFFSLKKIILDPLILLQNATQRLQTALSDGADTNYDRVMIGTGDEIDTLGQNFNAMAEDLIRSQEQLQRTVGRLKTLTDETPDAVITINPDGTISDVNKTFLHLFGGTAQDHVGSPIEHLGATTGEKEMILHSMDRVAGGQGLDLEWTARRHNGEFMPVFGRFRLMPLGDVSSVLAVVTDITERRRAEEALKESEARYRRLVESLGRDYFFYTHDTAGVFTYVSPSVSDMLGYTQDEFKTHYATYLTDDPVNREAVEKTNRSLQGIKQLPYQVEIRGKTGCPCWMEVSETPIFGADGRVIAVEGIAHDITARKLAQEALRESEARFRSMFEHHKAVMLIIEPQTGAIMDANTAALAYYGYPRDQLCGMHIQDINQVPPEEVALERQQAAAEQRNYFIFPHRLSDGNVRWVEVYSTPFETQGKSFLFSIIHDITERKRAEQALRESEQRYRTLFDSAPVGISVMKSDRHFEYLNPRFTEMLGYTLDDLPDKETWFQKAYPDPDYRKQVKDFWLKDLFEEKIPEAIAERILQVITKDGQKKIIHFRSTALENGDHVITYEDITELQNLNESLREEIAERILAEEALRESELRYRTLFDSAPVGISVSTADGSIEAINDCLIELMRAPSREEAFRLDLKRVYLDPAERERLLEKISRDGFVRNYETRLRGLDDSTKDVIMTMNRIVFAGKDAILTVIQDITWKKQAEEEAQHLRNYLANIIDSMPSVLVGVDKDGYITQWNPAAEKETGIASDVAKEKLLTEVLPFLSHQMELVRDALLTRQPQSYHKMQSQVGEENRYTDITVYPLVTNGVEGCVVRIDDVTDRVRIEEMMIQSEKMLSVGGLAAGMAHEINNPLGIVLAAAQNVLRRVSPDLPANIQAAEACGISLETMRAYLEKRQVLTFLEDIRTGVARASQIVSNMLSFSRKADEVGQQENLAALLDQTVLLADSDYDLKKKYDFRQIELVREYDRATPPVLCQASKIQQVFLNILRNGAEAMEVTQGAEHPSRFNLRVFPEGTWVQVEIEDNGPGMGETTRRRVFEPFFTTKPPGIGTGLGLSVSYFIITENHGGTISVESKPDTGARFIIRLPAPEKPT
jgi:PAS domain S-box-containing protein